MRAAHRVRINRIPPGQPTDPHHSRISGGGERDRRRSHDPQDQNASGELWVMVLSERRGRWKAAAMPNHASSARRLYNRRRDELSLDEAERIAI
jgi:hypothetical protein